MNTENIKKNIAAALAALPDVDFSATAQGLLETLGYQSELTLELRGSVDEVVDDLGLEKKHTNTARNLSDNVRSAGFIFQVGADEIDANGQKTLDWGTASFERGHTERFNFVAVELRDRSYARGKYAEFTREINAWFNAPTVILFKTADNRLTLAFVHRRQHKHDPSRDVLGSVSLVREINPTQPHRAHLDILAELSLEHLLPWMSDHNKPYNFDGLLAAWLDTLDTETLNKRFYTELFHWFEWAVGEATFPTKEEKVLPPQEHVIRLITRLLFVWFLKEKVLVADDLFNETKISNLLKNYDRDSGDAYYRAVLQNLFFATLNTETDKRGFSKTKNSTHRNFSLYRYKQEIVDPQKLLALFAQTPFINGGLFDCLDSEEGIREGGYRIDCFSDNERHYSKLSLPNRLFFDPQRGVFPLLNHYKFTVEENTPVEQEVALDPELLGKVFENLLAAYNPETRDTARKQTGSYYTPRAVVDYMVDEALIASLAQKCQPTDGDAEFWRERLRYLLNYEDAFNDADELFDADEAHGIVRAIADLKVLDPAVGSGAFPMGVLHKLTLALGRIDPGNTRWAALQKERARAKADAAFETKDQQERDAELLEISETFEKYSGDFGRKLYLIQNSIFGVDIQPIACQIAKLRFFISLAIEQQPDETAKNFGIKPLPNLETRFIAADTLLKLKDERMLTSEKAQSLERQLLENREQHFHASTRRKKLAYKKKDKQLRGELAKVLESLGFPADDANKIAQWDPYDQNASAEWFDTEYMFGNRDGFDVAIGNPPYVQLQKEGGKLGRLYKDSGYKTFARTGDIYQLFYERGCQLAAEGGHLCYITSNKWMRAGYGEKTREFLVQNTALRQVVDFGELPVFEAGTDPAIVLTRTSTAGADDTPLTAAVIKRKEDIERLSDTVSQHGFSMNVGSLLVAGWTLTDSRTLKLLDKTHNNGTPLKEWDIAIYRGIVTGLNEAFVIDDATKEALIAEDPNSAEIIKPVLRGQDIQRYRAEWAGLWLIDAHNGYGNVPAVDIGNYPAIKNHLGGFYTQLERRQDKGRTPYNLRNCAYHAEFAKPKIVYADIAKHMRATYDTYGYVLTNTAYMLATDDVAVLGVLCSKLFDWYSRQTFQALGDPWCGGRLRYFAQYMENIPMFDRTKPERKKIADLVTKILSVKTAGPQADTGEWEAQIDRLVYGLYGLTAEEIAAVEGRR